MLALVVLFLYGVKLVHKVKLLLVRLLCCIAWAARLFDMVAVRGGYYA